MKITNFSESILPAPKNGGFRMDDYWVWCGSVIRGEDAKYHMFASRWPKHLPMHPGWLVHSEVVRAVSDTPEGPYTFAEIVFPARGAEFWDGRSTHNPHITKHGDTYILYYMGSTNPLTDVLPGESFGLNDPRCIVARANKRIGIATAPSVFGPWTRKNEPILPTSPDTFYSFLTSNPAPVIHMDGSALLIFKARKYEGNTHGSMMIGVAKADHYDGVYRVANSNPIFPPESMHLEDPFVWKTQEGYELIAKDMDGRICGEKHAGIHAISKDGLHWEATYGTKAYSRQIVWDDGTEQRMGNLERPFILFHDGKPTHLFFATADGPGGFAQASNTWNMVIPLKTMEE